MNAILLSLTATNSGWLFRQVLKLIAAASVSMTAFLAGQGVPEHTTAAVVAGVAAVLSWGAEIGLSKLASKIATPCLALFACLALASCGALPSGEKTFLGIDSAGWLNVGKSASVAAVPVALNERAKVSAKNPITINP
jgi:hypothetical protein